MINNNLILEIVKVLKIHFSGVSENSIANFQSVTGGADTIIYGFTVKTDEIEKNLILRIFREGSSNTSAEKEFYVLDKLHTANVSVPKPYGIIIKDEGRGPCLIMEKIEGTLLADLMRSDLDNFSDYLYLLTKTLFDLHKIDCQKTFEDLDLPDIVSDPLIITKNKIKNSKEKVENFNLNEVRPLIEWIETNMKHFPCTELVVLHGDYHAMNLILTPEKELTIIDWADVNIGDRRQDLAYAILAMESFVPVKNEMIEIYQSLLGEPIKDVEFFMIVSVLHNIIRITSMLFNFEILNENETTKKVLIYDHRDYTDKLINTVKEITGLEFPETEKEIKRYRGLQKSFNH